MTPAALSALAKGDISNFIAASTPGGIEAQEKRGQLEQAQLQTLPFDGTSEKDRPKWEELGFQFKRNTQNDRDDIFVECTFPAGWQKKPTDHSMWSDLVDAKGRKRGAIFYKAAFYDRSAQCHLKPRFRVTEDYSENAPRPRAIIITDVLGEVNKRIEGLPEADWNDRPEAEKRQALRDAAKRELVQWLDENFPLRESPSAYWD